MCVYYTPTDQRVLGDRSAYGPHDQRWNKSEMLAAKMDKFLAVSMKLSSFSSKTLKTNNYL